MPHEIGVPVSAQAPDPDMLRETALREIQDFAEQMRETFTRGATPTEIAAWPNKAERARRYLAGAATEVDTMALSLEAQTRGLDETPHALAELQLSREAQYAQAVAFIDGLASRAARLIADAEAKDIPLALQSFEADVAEALREMDV